MKLHAAMLTVAIMSGAPATAEKPIEVMVLGTWHFANPNRDLYNVKSDDVLAPRRQIELQRLAEVLAKFKPTKIMIEKMAKTPDLIDPGFSAYTPEMLKKERNERIQIGYRIAYNLSLSRVYAIDEQASETEPNYYPYEKVAEYAQAHDQDGVLERDRIKGGEAVREFNEKQSRMSIPALLIEVNGGKNYFNGMDSYYDLLKVGDTDQQPGAELNAMWYMRNAKTFAKLITVAEPGDRILVVYGSGHNFWLRHFASFTPGFKNVDPIPYLKAAVAK